MPRRALPLWVYVVVCAVTLVLGAVVAAGLGGPDLISITPPSDGVTIAGAIVVEPASPSAGSMVVAHATVSADRVVTLSALTIKVRDEAGAFHDFPEQVNIPISTKPQQIVFSRQFAEPGSYTYYLSYLLAGERVNLPPWQKFTIR